LHKHSENTHSSELSAVSTQKFQGPMLERLVHTEKKVQLKDIIY